MIIGGHDAPKGRYPYFATFDHFGGGVLIAPDIVLTAGHCNPPLEQRVKVRLNHDTFQSTNFATEPADEETFTIETIQRNPDFYTISWDETVNDFNLFKLSGFSQQKPVKLNRNPNLPQDEAMVTVVGMGSTDPNPDTFVETSATTLQEVELKIISHEQCEESFDPNRPDQAYKGRIFEESMVCTSGGPHNKKDACAFDSGSPLLLTSSNSHVQQDTVVGLVSWGENCADPFFPAVNARVASAMDWIDKTVCELSEADPSLLTEFNCVAPTLSSVGPFAIHGSTGSLFSTNGWGNNSYFMVAGTLVLKACMLLGIVGAAIQKLATKRNGGNNETEQVPLQSADAKAAPPFYDTL